VPHARMVERLVEEVVPQLRALEIAPAVGR
jgi:hypothetical protein